MTLLQIFLTEGHANQTALPVVAQITAVVVSNLKLICEVCSWGGMQHRKFTCPLKSSALH